MGVKVTYPLPPTFIKIRMVNEFSLLLLFSVQQLFCQSPTPSEESKQSLFCPDSLSPLDTSDDSLLFL